jgi:hypothetical protein
MHPALRSWRNDLPPNIVLAYLGAVALLSMASAHFSQSPKVMGAITPVHPPEWIAIERPFAAFALSIPEAADVQASYTIRRHAEGNGRKDILTLGEPDSGAFVALSNKAPQYGGALLQIYEHLRSIGPCSTKQIPATLR